MSDTLLEIPGYRVHGQLGKGGMAEVFLATQESLGRKVAIKVLSSAEDQGFCQRFVKEAHTLAALNHPSIITIHDIDRLADGRHYLAMEFLPGGDLARHKGELFAPERALQIIRQVASGLAVVHDKGLVHRDVKPANILFRDDGTAVLSDFGVAKDLDVDSELTQFGIAVGSPAYSSPEQAQCQALDVRSDIYSLGVILLEMLTGTNPFRGGNYTQTVVNHVQMQAPLPDSLGAFRPLLERMLAKEPTERFADCRALLAALDEVELSDLDATRIRPAQALPVPAAPSRLRLPLLALGLLVLIASLVAGGLYLREQRQIAALLAQAEQRFAAGQLIEPAHDSAEHYFTQVLALDADDEAALAGLQRVLAARIERALQLAEQSIADKRLLLPEQDSAVHYYRQILSWAPGNAQAQAGLNHVALLYRDLARAAYRRGDFPGALAMIERGLQVDERHPELLKMRDEHQRLLDEARAARSDAAPRKREENPIKRVWNNLFGQ